MLALDFGIADVLLETLGGTDGLGGADGLEAGPDFF